MTLRKETFSQTCQIMHTKEIQFCAANQCVSFNRDYFEIQIFNDA